ncbi:MAG TPA: DUF1361 domain-containing protein [Bacteroidia bacterium]|nr:DUF1361 domain-containing protein [Bacteroidia bacterium]
MIKPTFKQLVYSFTLFSVTLLTYRIIKSDGLSYIFLAWNLFLALIPWWISDYLKQKETLQLKNIPLLGTWLLFIPNSPYILTDLFHLKPRLYLPLWFDLVLVLSFALIGMLVFLKSLKDMLSILKTYVSPMLFTLITPVIFWLIAFGLYLGRYLRFNSWNVVNHPFRLMRQSFDVLLEKDTIGFTLIFGVFMWFMYYITMCLNQNEKA